MSGLKVPVTAAVAVGNRRLLKLAERLDTVPRKQFDYNDWVGWDWKGKPDLSCGTTACALGWATTMPMFRRLGLTLEKHNGLVGGGVITWNGTPGAHVAACDLFALAVWESQFLFEPQPSEYNATAKQVAKKIRKFVSRRARSLEPSAPSK